jgi:hypothetical protein
MKSKVLERKMFKEPEDPEDVGIMQGFIQMIASEDVDEKEAEEYETNRMMGRTPDSPEIIMNNLRGDMKSVDARREELADKVGYNAAMETPDEVLALLQQRFAEEEQQGLAALMPQGMPPGMMPAGGPPMIPPLPPEGIANLPTQQGPMPAPIPMKDGGIVQNFRNGSLPSGVTPIVQRFANGTGLNAVQPLTLESLMAQQPSVVPDLASSITSSKELAEKLGAGYSKDLLTANLLAQASPAFFDFATRGDTLDLLKNLSGAASQTAALKAKSDQDLLKVAIPLATSSRDAAIAANEKLREAKVKILAKQAGMSPFGSGFEGRASEIVSNMTPLILKDPDKLSSSKLFQYVQSVAKTKEKGTKRTQVTDPLTKLPTYVDIDTKSQFDRYSSGAKEKINKALGIVDKLLKQDEKTPALSSEINESIVDLDSIPLSVTKRFSITDSGVEETNNPSEDSPEFALNNQITLAEDTTIVPTVKDLKSRVEEFTKNSLDPESKYNVENLWSYSEDATGPFNVIFGKYLRGVPILGPELDQYVKEQTQAIKYYENSEGEFIRALRESGDADKMAEGERKQIKAEIGLTPSVFDNPAFLRDRLIALDNTLISKIRGFSQELKEPELNIDDKKMLISRITELKKVRKKIGVPTRVPSYRKEDGTLDKEKIQNLLLDLYEKNKGKPFEFLYKDEKGAYQTKIFPNPNLIRGDN